MSAVDERVSRLLTPVVAASGLDLDAVEISKAGRRRLLRVIVDGATGPSLDEVAEVSRAVSEALDASEVMGEQPYVLRRHASSLPPAGSVGPWTRSGSASG